MPNILTLALKILSLYSDSETEQEQVTEDTSAKDDALLSLKQKLGAVIVILGTRGTGKTELAYRLAEFLGKPIYAVSPEQKPPIWMQRVTLEDVAKLVKPNSTLILDDLPAYASNRDYNESLIRELERLIPMVRHERKLHLIFSSQSAAQADKYILDCDMAFFKPLGLLMGDVERPFVRRIYQQYVDTWFDGKDDYWIVKHAFMFSRTYKGLIEVKKAT